MTFPANIPKAAVELVLSFLLPILLPSLDGDIQGARALALHLLDDHNPQTARELRLAGEAIGYSIKGLAMLADSAEPAITAEKRDTSLKWACGLSRSGHQAQRRLDELQRPARRNAPRDLPVAEAIPPQDTVPTGPLQETAPPSSQAAALEQPLTVAQAEAALQSAEKLLILMKAHHKGAPPPHSQAAQQIQAQQRLVDTARLRLQHARRQLATPEPTPSSLQAAA
jgi:hypothetical protein